MHQDKKVAGMSSKKDYIVTLSDGSKESVPKISTVRLHDGCLSFYDDSSDVGNGWVGTRHIVTYGPCGWRKYEEML